MKALITVDTIKQYRPLSKEISIDRIAPYILEAQLNDIQPMLGDTLFTDLVKKFATTGDPMYASYQELLFGKEYTPTGSAGPILFDGIAPAIAYFALARFFEGNPVNVTRFGVVQKLNENFSEPVSPQVLASAISSVRANGTMYLNKAVDFLNSNTDTYTYWKYSQQESLNRTGIKFFDV
jgi:hypothetical protein